MMIKQNRWKVKMKMKNKTEKKRNQIFDTTRTTRFY
jgi:hypothetical protein